MLLNFSFHFWKNGYIKKLTNLKHYNSACVLTVCDLPTFGMSSCHALKLFDETAATSCFTTFGCYDNWTIQFQMK